MEHNSNEERLKINLPCKWDFYIYNKNEYFKTKSNSKPHVKICSINTVNDVIYLFQIMKVEISNVKEKKINLDMNNNIIMRNGIEPVWEDPKNVNGTTVTIKIPYKDGYELWTLFIMYLFSETLINKINGIGLSYIQNVTEERFYYIKIWDSITRKNIIDLLPDDIKNIIKTYSIRITENNGKKDFNKPELLKKHYKPKIINRSFKK